MPKTRGKTKASNWRPAHTAAPRRAPSRVPLPWWLLAGGAVVVLAIVAFVFLNRGGSSNNLAGGAVGAQAADFSLPTVGGGTFSLADYLGKKNVLLYFNEGYG